MRKIMEDRGPVVPDDLPSFGSLLKTSTGHLAEVVGWFGENPNRNAPYAHERIAFALIVDGPTDGARPGTMVLSCFPESTIVSSEPQRLPRFARWLINSMLTGEGE